jgi:putative inorganic carbon (hco3(-)) transporter
MTVSRVRFHALIWIIAVSLCYYGVKGGLFTIITGGGSHVYGPAASIIGDNNQLAVALLMVLPLLYYLRLHTRSNPIRLGLAATMALIVLTVLGTYSRGGLIALAVVAAAFWLRTRKKLIYPAIALVVGLSALSFMPPEFWARLDTIRHPQSDPSFVGRENSWHVAYGYAVDHFPFGAGIYGPQLGALYHQYEPDARPLAAHSIYFQVLGENGFVGLALYLAMIGSSLLDLRKIRRATRGAPDLLWARDLASMLQLSLLAFAVGGAALSMAYYDLFVIDICVGSALRRYVNVALAIPAQQPALEEPITRPTRA